ncbi:MAG: 2-oxo acid dehydrogenase subunit E2, partial [Myxococcota bacterium]
TAEIPAPVDGVVESLLAGEGDIVPVGTIVARIAPNEVSTQSDTTTQSGTKIVEETNGASAVNEGIITPPPKGRRLPNRRLVDQTDGAPSGPRRTSPAVRRLARTHGVNLHALSGSGYRGRVTRDDILAEVERRSVAPQPVLPPQLQTDDGPPTTTMPAAPMPAASMPLASMPAAPMPVVAQSVISAPAFRPPKSRPGPRDRVEPLGRRRQRIAQNLKYSQQTAAHVATVAEIDMHAVLSAKKIDGAHCEAEGVRLTVLAYVVQAIAITLSEVPQLNATIDEENVIWRSDRNVGIAVDTPSGVMVPVIKRADELGLMGIARAIDELSTRTRDGKATPDDLADGTFTVSNPGKEGNLFGVSIIRQPEVGILRMGSVVKRPVVRTIGKEDAIVIRPIMHAALSYDHRLIDGRTGNGFLYRLARRLEAIHPTFEPPRTN